LLIALVVGTVLTAINQLDVILSGDATAATAVKSGLNYVVPVRSGTPDPVVRDSRLSQQSLMNPP
jgi:hypothetical protein